MDSAKSASSLQDAVCAALREDAPTEVDSYPTADGVRSNPNLQVNGATPNKLALMEQKALSNDFAARINYVDGSKPVITGALLKDDVLLREEDAFQEQQRKLGNGTLTPERKKDGEGGGGGGRIAIAIADRRPEGSVFVPSHKRAGSIPPRLIEETLELERQKKQPLDIYNRYSQIKTTTRSILPGLSPKFELLQNEVSPIEEKDS